MQPSVTLRSVAMELTPRCNQQCVYCYNPWRRAPAESHRELKTEEVCRLVDKLLAEAKVGHITLTGGEPLLRQDLFSIIDHINGRGLPVGIISNGCLIDEAAAAALAARRVIHVQVTLTGPEHDLHDAHCGMGNFAKTVAAVGRLVAAGVAVGGSFLCTRRNYASAGETLERMHAVGVRSHFAFNRFNPSGSSADRAVDLLPRRSEVREALRQASAFAEAHDLQIHCTMPIPRCMIDEQEFPRIGFGQCAVGTANAEYSVDPQGSLKFCTLQRRSIGSLLETSLAELLARGEAERFRATLPVFCRPCPHHRECLGGCHAAAEWVFGRADEVDPFLAQHVMPELLKRNTPLGPKGRTAGGEGLPEHADEVREDGVCIRIDPWYDLVYHVLAHLRIAPEDAATLYDETYVRWSEEQFSRRADEAFSPRRTLVADAGLVASAYDGSEQGYLLHAWPLLFDGLGPFLDTAGVDFGQLDWPDGETRRLAEAIGSFTQPALPELFRDALRGEWTGGYGTIWREEVVPRARAYRKLFVKELTRLATVLPGLRDVVWVLSHPLGCCGRLLRRANTAPVIVVGVGDEDRGLASSLPVLQGCHEYFLWQVQQEAPSSDRWATKPGRAGYDAFRRAESLALARGAQFFRGSPWEAEYLRWLGRLLPEGPLAL